MSADSDFLSKKNHGVEIYTATAEDISVIAELSQEIWPECYTQLLGEAQVKFMLELFYSHDALQSDFDRGVLYFLAASENTPVGYLGIIIEGEKLFISRLYIKKEARGKGLGSRLLKLAEKKARQSNSKSIYLTVNRGNKNAIDTYKRNGFTCKEEICKYIGGGFCMDDYIMEKKLQ